MVRLILQRLALLIPTLAFGISLSGTVRFEYALTGERRETPGTVSLHLSLLHFWGRATLTRAAGANIGQPTYAT